MASQSDLAPLQGSWRFVVIEANGWRGDFSDGEGKTISIEGDEWVSTHPRRPGLKRTHFALEPAKHRFDFLILPAVVTPGIYCLDAQSLLLCTNQRALMRATGTTVEGDERAPPSSFSAPAGSHFRLWILERVP
jgi:uncharacterized protein (TIGR03067 family)